MPKHSIYIASSPWFNIIGCVLYFNIGLALYIANIPWWVIVPGFLFLGLDLRRVIYLHGLRQHKYAVRILCQDCDKWQYQLKSGKEYRGTLIPKYSFCSRFMLILYIEHLRGARYIIIPRDALSAHNFRTLVFKLKS